MKINELNGGDIFRFPKGKAEYIMIYAMNTEAGWMIRFAHTKTGQKYYFYDEGGRFNPIDREVIRLKKRALKPIYHKESAYVKSYYELPENKIEKKFNIKLKK